ncbi:MAG: potassium channel family protein [Pseudomonadota bacterium]|nr:potassium channel family protein [Pseudomonadota bacterium]
MNVAIILAGFPILWDYTPLVGLLRQLRLLLLLALLAQFIPSVRQVLLRNHLGYTLLIAIVITVVSGILISQVDPAISSIGDGMWFAWVTLTTVGYGDVVPKSTAGRLIGGVLTFLGVVFFSLISANLAAFLVRRDVEKVERKAPSGTRSGICKRSSIASSSPSSDCECGKRMVSGWRACANGHDRALG